MTSRRFASGAVAALAMAGASAGVLACQVEPRIEERTIYVYSPRSCPVSQSRAFSVIYGNGDFETENQAVSSLYLRDLGTTLTGLPNRTRSVIVDVTDFTNPLATIDWRGTAEVPARGPVNVLVWPGGETCNLSRNVERRSNTALGVFGRHLMIAGGSFDGPQVPHTFVGDLSTGLVVSLEYGLGARRASPTITAFRDLREDPSFPSPALVAGGEDPDSARPLGTAQVYVPVAGAPGDIGDFEARTIELSEPRRKHGAVVLTTGETLLVGGIGEGATPLRSMEIVDPVTRRFRTNGVALLTVARSNPTVLRLASGEILVAGGLDAKNQAVATLEWFSADGSHPTKRPIDLVTGRERAFVALDGGGALAVIAPNGVVPDFRTVWVISADGTLEPGLPVDPMTLDMVRLFPGTDGAPALWTGRRWLRWEPWFSAFQPIPDAPTGEEDGPKGQVVASGDSGLALWLEDVAEADTYVKGYRFSTRSRYGVVRKPLLVDGVAGLAPDRATGLPGSTMRFVADRGLELGAGSSAFLTDVTFADVLVDMEVSAATPTLVLRQESGRELEVGGGTCAFTKSGARSLHVERRGSKVSVRIDDGELRTCPGELDATSRVSLGVRGAVNEPFGYARNLRVTRL